MPRSVPDGREPSQGPGPVLALTGVKRLAGDERVVLDLRPHWKLLVAPAVAVVVVSAAALAAVVAGMAGWLHWAAAVLVVVAVARLIGRYARWSTTHLVVTDRRIVERKGFLRRFGREIPLAALADIGYRQSLLDRMIGCGDVLIESAGRDSEEVFADLSHPARIQSDIYALMARSRFPAGASIAEQIDQLDRLRQRGVVTDAEFAAKKAELLDRL